MPPVKKFEEKVNFMARRAQVEAVRRLARTGGEDDSVIWRELVDEALQMRALVAMSTDPAEIGRVVMANAGRRLPVPGTAA